MITNFWNWMYQTVQAAINTLTTIYQNSEFTPFFNLLLVVVGIGVIIKFILSPLLGSSLSGASDKAVKSSKNRPRDAHFREVE